ncbi:MAG: hypothetical protein ACK518_01615 [bacterium]|jgi:hypothetical protein
MKRQQKALKKWMKEKWRYSSPSVAAKVKKTGKPARFLPDAAWKKLTPAQRAATNRKKLASKKQFVPNTAAAKRAGKTARRT